MAVPDRHRTTPRPARPCTRAALGVAFLAASVLAAAPVPVSSPRPRDEAGRLVITADTVEAREGPRGREATLEGEVTLTSGDATLVAERGLYYESEGLAILFGRVRGVDAAAEITCDTLRYLRDSDTAILSGHASYADTSGITSAHRIVMHRREDVAVCLGDAVATDRRRTSELRAGRISYDFGTRTACASQAPLLETYTDDGELDAVLRADVMEFDPRRSRVTAFGRVRIERGVATARARVATMDADRDLAILEGDPAVEQESDRLTGDRILVFGRDHEISRVVSIGRARAEYSIEAGGDGEEPQRGSVLGDTLSTLFQGGDPLGTRVRGNASSQHFVGTSGERNEIASEDIDVFFTEGRVSRVVFRGPARGTYFYVPEEPSAGEEARATTESTALDSVGYAAQEAIDYYVGRNRIVLSGAARVEHGTTVLSAEEVVFDPDAQVLSASGSPDLREAEERLVGGRLAYDLDARSGAISDGVTTFEDGLYYGDRIMREAGGALLVRGGLYTTCSAAPPHYRIESRRMKVYLDDKVIASPIVLYVGEMPVFALPFYVFPIRKDRHSGFLIPRIELGLSERGGRFVRNFGYYLAPSDYWDLSAWGDYYEQTKWIGHAEARYKLRYVLSGSFTTSVMQELRNNKRRWDLQFSHRQELGRSWTAGASGEFRSDATYASDTNQSIEESVNRSLHSQLWTRGRSSGLSVGITVDRREELDEGTVSELLPKVDVTASQRPLVKPSEARGISAWLGTVSASWDARAVNDRDRSRGKAVARQAVGVGATVQASGRPFGWLNLTPRLSVRQNWYDRDKRGREFPGRFTYDAGVSAGTTVYGTFAPRLGPLEAVRHILEPSAAYTWTPEFTSYFDENGSDIFYTLSGFGATPRDRRALALSLVQKLQLKVASDGEVTKLDNLARLSVSTSYDFKEEERPWADVSSLLDVRPGHALSLQWTTRHDAYDGSIQNSTVTASIDLLGAEPAPVESWEDRIGGGAGSPVDELRREIASRESGVRAGVRPWDASFTFRHSRGAGGMNASTWADVGLALSPTPNWRLNWSMHYDIAESEVASQEYTIYRDLHCWEAQFTRRYYEGEWQYYFRVSVKAVPEIQAETGEKYLERSVR